MLVQTTLNLLLLFYLFGISFQLLQGTKYTVCLCLIINHYIQHLYPMDNSREDSTCLVALNETSCIETNILIAYYENSTILAIMLGSNIESLYSDLLIMYPDITFVKQFEAKQSRELVEKLESYILNPKQNPTSFNLKIEGTEFQKLVWSELLKIPYGKLHTYSDVARDIGRPKSMRAVANACGKNNIPIIIPCHRVIRSDGTYGGYSSGKDIKETLIKLELNIMSNTTQ